MKFTLLPDMEEKRKNRQKRKRLSREKKIARNDRRRRKYLAKRDTFGRIFVKRWLILIIISACISAVGTVMVERYARSVVKTVYNSWKQHIETTMRDSIRSLDDMGDKYTDEEKRDMFRAEIKSSMIEYNYSSLYDFSAIMYEYDKKTEKLERLCDSKSCAIVSMWYYSDAGAKSEKTHYVCPLEFFDDIDNFEEVAENSHGINNDFYWVWGMADFYIKGSEFRPGNVSVVKTKGDGYTVAGTRKHYDLTPDDVSGWVHVICDEEHEKVYNNIYPHVLIGYYADGTKVGSEADRLTDSFVLIVNKYGFQSASYGEGYYGRRECLDEQQDYEMYFPDNWNLEWESMGKEYYLFTAGIYDFYERHLNDCIKVYCIILLAVTFIAIFISRSRWLRVKAQYEMEDYRKSMTDAMAHDLKSPLMALSGFAENLKENVHTEKRQYYADAISENVNYMNGIIERILELSKTETSNIKLERSEIELQDLLDEVIAKYDEKINEKELIVDAEGNVTLNADRQLMLQAIDNLISNAVKFSKEHSLINVVMDKNSIRISNSYEPGEDKLDCLDLLKPFVKGDESRSNKSGSGIGLTIAKNIFELHGYTLKLAADDDTFTVTVRF